MSTCGIALFFLTACRLPFFNTAPIDPIVSDAEWEDDADLKTIEPQLKAAGMLRMVAHGQKTDLGSQSSLASDWEKPLQPIGFTDDFFLDSTEITRERFESFTGKRLPLISEGGDCPKCPAAPVTFYDAIAFCNARSLALGLDTVYAYLARQEESNGRIFAMSGLTPHFEKLGFRLPTEAEWEWSANDGAHTEFSWGNQESQDSASRYAWYRGHGSDSAHAVASLKPNAHGLYDMTGNVFEWVHDFLGRYSGIETLNSIGSARGGQDEHVVKGGAFSYGLSALRPSARKMSYAALASTSSRDVGFRCAIGRIRNPQYLPDPTDTATNRASVFLSIELAAPQWPLPLAAMELGHNAVGLNFTESQLLQKPGKLAFVYLQGKDRKLGICDFTVQPPALMSIDNLGPVHAPTFSPDGKWLAFSDRGEGDAGFAKTWVMAWPHSASAEIQPRHLDVTPSELIQLPVEKATLPHWHVDPVTGDTSIVYASSGISNIQPSWLAEGTYRISFRDGEFKGSPEKFTEGSFHDGVSKDGRYLATGYQRLLMRDRNQNSTEIFFTGPYNGKPVGDTSQVCNVSMAPSLGLNGHTLFLDFGDGARNSLVNRPYGLHEILFHANEKGKVLQWLTPPSSSVAFADAAWSNHPRFAVTALENAAGDRKSLALIDLATETVTPMLLGAHFSDPSLWIPIPNWEKIELQLDSLGQYNSPARSIYQMEFAAKMKTFWERRNLWQILCLGSSHMEMGIRTEDLTLPAANLGWSAGGFLGSATLLRNYGLNHVPNLKTVVIEITPGWMHLPDMDLTWKPEMSQTKGYRYDASHAFWKDSVPPHLDSVMAATPHLQGFDTLGNIFIAAQNWGPTNPTLPPGELGWTLNNPIVQANLDSIAALLKDCEMSSVKVILLHFPMSPYYRQTPWFSEYGPDSEVGPQVLAAIEEICDHFSTCSFYDAHQNGLHDFPDSEAFDAGHLATPGAHRLTHRLDSLIRTLPDLKRGLKAP